MPAVLAYRKAAERSRKRKGPRRPERVHLLGPGLTLPV